jgi:FG-GAP-like repeat/F5/8 type C domain/Bacterial Ig domain/FG-GAP repeat
MRIIKRLSFCVLLSFFLLTVTSPLAEVRAQNGLPLFESPWRGFDTGAFAEGFDPGGFGPVAVAVGDLDGDRDPDLLVGNWYSPRPGLSVLLNAGNGTYGWPAFYTLPDGKSVADVALSDVDGDGDLDALATVPDFNGASNILALWRNNGDATFAPHVEFATGPGPKGLALADFNGDGFADVATANHGYVSLANNTVSVILHNGQKGAAAGFRAPTDFAVSGMDTQRVAAADVNGDGRPDLAVGGKGSDINGGKIAVLFNDGAGGFNLSATYVSYPNSRLPSAAVALADLDKDGDADLIGGGMVTNGTDDKGLISIRRNAGNGTFGAAEAYVFESNVPVPSSFALADLNRDGFTDVVATTPSGRTMDGWVALLSNGTGGFLPTARYEASQDTRDVVLADANHDSFIDVLTVASSSAAVTVHRNTGVGTFILPPRHKVGLESNGLVGNAFAALEAGDLDHDGDMDVVTTDEKAYILKNNGKGTFAPAVAYTPPINPAEVKLRDLNGDGHLDLLFGPDRSAPPYHFGTSLNNGDGTFAAGTVTNVNACQAGSIDAFDLDNDGDLDVVLTEEGSCQFGPGFRIFIFRNDGRANFTLVTTLNPPCGPSGIGGGDLNGDGRIDLVTRSCAGVGVHPGNGDLTFKPQLESGVPPYRFKLADLNGDGRLDLAMILTNIPAFTTVVGTSLGNGDGTFAPARKQSGSSVGEALVISSDIDVADADGDGDADLFVSNNASNDLSLFLNNGDGSVRRHERYGVGYATAFAAVADFDKDGAVDVASNIGLPQLGTKSAVVVLRNTRLDVIVGVPNAVVTSPANGSVYDAPATIHIAAEVYPVPGRSISKVEFWLGDGKGTNPKLIHTDTTAPYGDFDLPNLPAGTYSLYAYAYDSVDVGISGGVLFEVKTPPVGDARINVALAANGAIASASSQYNASFPVAAAINGDRYALRQTDGSFNAWHSASGAAKPDWLQVDFNGSKTIGEIDVVTMQDDYANPVNPTESTVSTLYSLTSFQVQYWDGSGWVAVQGGVVSGNDRVWRKFTFPEVTTTKVRLVVSGSADGFSRVMELEAWGRSAVAPPSARANFALASGGATATASSQYNTSFPADATINGDRYRLYMPDGRYNNWHSASGAAKPDWLQINLAAPRAIDEVVVVTQQDDYSNPVEPTDATTFTNYGATGFEVQYWNGSGWQTVSGGSVTANNRVLRRFTFPEVTTDKLRVLVRATADGFSRLVEVEAWGSTATTPPPPPAPDGRTNVALAANGAIASASSQYNASFPADAAINGDRYHLYTSDSRFNTWHSASGAAKPDWLQVDFNGNKTIGEIDVVSMQDDYTNPVNPTEDTTVQAYGLTSFEVQYWNGTAWQTVTGGSVTGNNRVWRKFTFPALTTSKIRVLVHATKDPFTRIMEVEAWTQ